MKKPMPMPMTPPKKMDMAKKKEAPKMQKGGKKMC